MGSDTEGIVPSRSPDTVMVSEVIEAFEPQIMDPGPNRPIEETVNDLMSEFLGAGHRRVDDISFGDVLVGPPRKPRTESPEAEGSDRHSRCAPGFDLAH